MQISGLKKYLIETIHYALDTTLVRLIMSSRGKDGDSLENAGAFPENVGSTTLIVAFIHDNTLYYGSIGDSVIYLFNNAPLKILKSRDMEFLSKSYFPEEFLETGMRELKPGATVVLASDGLPECVYGKSTLLPVHITRCLDKSPTRTAINLVELAFSKGGEDNLGIVVYCHDR